MLVGRWLREEGVRWIRRELLVHEIVDKNGEDTVLLCYFFFEGVLRLINRSQK